jgi:hypothetical protein
MAKAQRSRTVKGTHINGINIPFPFQSFVYGPKYPLDVCAIYMPYTYCTNIMSTLSHQCSLQNKNPVPNEQVSMQSTIGSSPLRYFEPVEMDCTYPMIYLVVDPCCQCCQTAIITGPSYNQLVLWAVNSLWGEEISLHPHLQSYYSVALYSLWN